MFQIETCFRLKHVRSKLSAWANVAGLMPFCVAYQPALYAIQVFRARAAMRIQMK